MISRNKGKIKTKLSTKKKEIALMGFYFDIFNDSLFRIPILPIPMRIDKVTNGEPTYIIPLDLNKLKEVSEALDLYINFKSFYYYGIQNLINYAKEKYKSITFRNLNKDSIIKWYDNSVSTKVKLSSLTDDFTFLIINFLETYSIIRKAGNLNNADSVSNELIKYYKKMLDYFRGVINHNSIQVTFNGELRDKNIYIIKKKKYLPQLINIDIWNEQYENYVKGKFIPYLIYDDLIDICFYNLELLNNQEKEPINLLKFEENNILIQGKNLDFYYDTSQIEMQNVNLPKLLNAW